LRGRSEDIKAGGADLVFVGNGAVPFAKHFREREVPGFKVYTDPSRESYRALGLKRSLLGTLGPRSLLAGMRATSAGHVQTSVEGDAFQLGGFFAVARGGEIRYAELYSSAGDRPDIDHALAALRRDVRQSG
jgi:hypothetical protein